MAEAGEERQRLGSTGLPECWLSLKPITIPMGGDNEGDDGKSRRVIVEARVECNISSKGLGCSTVFKGQMRAQLDDQGNRGSDYDKNKTSNLKNGSEGGSEATCPVCSRSFHSKKAMYGHMRCHSEREWRGVNPPPSAKTASCSSVSQEINGLSHSSKTSTVVSYSTSGSSSNISSSHKIGIKTLQVGNLKDYPSYKCTTCNKVFLNYRALGGHRSSHSYKNNLAMENTYKCHICNKTFPTGKALGGHQTIHRQKPAQLAAPNQEALILSTEEASQSAGPRVFDFDLNELPPMEEE